MLAMWVGLGTLPEITLLQMLQSVHTAVLRWNSTIAECHDHSKARVISQIKQEQYMPRMKRVESQNFYRSERVPYS